jgi:TNF receptor-associated protein 1
MLPKQQVEINPSHPIIVGLNVIRDSKPTLAKVLAEQVFDNCLIAAGLMDDSRSMLPRLNDMLIAGCPLSTWQIRAMMSH